MTQHIIPTNLHCGSCVTKLGNVLDKEERIHHWSADVSKPEKPVTVHGNLSQADAVALIEKAGFKAYATETAACAMPAVQVEKSLQNFWADKKVWRRASFNILNCLIGCSIGDFGMIIFLQVYYPQTPMGLQMALAVVAGLTTSVLLETSILHLKEKLVWKAALKMALSMSFLSMVAMELVMNATDFMITGGKAQLSSVYYWMAFIPAALAGFLAPLPYNYFRLKKYKRRKNC